MLYESLLSWAGVMMVDQAGGEEIQAQEGA